MKKKTKNGFTLVELLIAIEILSIIGIFILNFIGSGNFSAFTDQETAIRVLSNQGFTDIRLGGYNPFACAEDDDYATEFIAKNPYGNYVKGVVCSSAFSKLATIRYE